MNIKEYSHRISDWTRTKWSFLERTWFKFQLVTQLSRAFRPDAQKTWDPLSSVPLQPFYSFQTSGECNTAAYKLSRRLVYKHALLNAIYFWCFNFELLLCGSNQNCCDAFVYLITIVSFKRDGITCMPLCLIIITTPQVSSLRFLQCLHYAIAIFMLLLVLHCLFNDFTVINIQLPCMHSRIPKNWRKIRCRVHSVIHIAYV